MANLTKVELRTRIAKHLRIYAKDVELDAADAASIDDSIDDCRAELMEKTLCWWGEDAIPQSVVFPLTLIVSAQACAKVGKMGQGYEGGDQDGRIRLAQIKGSTDSSIATADFY
jgi:hypothetical protein